MNAVEIEEAVTALAERQFDRAEFPYLFLEAFGNKDTTIKRLRAGVSNKSDVGGVLQTNNVHIAVAHHGEVSKTLAVLKASPATAKAKAKFVLATDGDLFEAEDLESGETVACRYTDFPNRFGFFLPLAGITTIKQLRDSSFDIRATSRLNRLYVELLRDNPEWGTSESRHDMNHFMARLIFCFFAEDTGIFSGARLFTETVAQMSAKDSSNTHEVIDELFRAMNTSLPDRGDTRLPRWADAFPYVNGGLFSGNSAVPRFSRIARSYFLHIGNLDWTKINPDIFGSMIQAVADDTERGALGMHYTSVSNIVKVLNPLFLDDLHARLTDARDNSRKLLNLRNRIARIRVFDPACGSGNFLVIAYKELRSIEADINRRRDEAGRPSDIPLTNFRGIELRDFPAEVARLALIIAEFQSDVLYRGKQLALAEFLPLNAENWITCGNALKLDWLSLCPPTGTGVKLHSDDLFGTPLNQAEIDFENQGGKTYICGNPQWKGARKQSPSQKEDLAAIFHGHNDYKDCDYVVGWFLKAAAFVESCGGDFAFVATNSISQGEQVAHLWSRLYPKNLHIAFAHQGFRWKNNAAHNAGVHCVIIGISKRQQARCYLYTGDAVRSVAVISPYLIPGPELYVTARDTPMNSELGRMVMGSMARDGGHLILTRVEASALVEKHSEANLLLKTLVGSDELIYFRDRSCFWIEDENLPLAESIPPVSQRIQKVGEFRNKSSAKTTRGYGSIPHKFAQRAHRDTLSIIVAATSSETRPYLPADLLDSSSVITNLAYAIYDPELWELAIILSKIHIVWIESVCGRLETRLRYSSTFGWNTFPVPTLTANNKSDLARCAQHILLAREAQFPATIDDLYNDMPADLREAHERNDEVLERIYIGRRFRNDTERMEKLLDLYIKAAAETVTGKKRPAGASM